MLYSVILPHCHHHHEITLSLLNATLKVHLIFAECGRPMIVETLF